MIGSIGVKKVAQLTGHNGGIFALSAFDQKDAFLSGGGDGWIVHWNFNNPDLGHLIAKVETQLFSLFAIPGSTMIVGGNMNGGVHWVNYKDPSLSKNIAHHQKGVYNIQMANGEILTCGGDGLLTRWSVDPVQSLESYQISRSSLRSMDYSKARNEIAIGSSDNNIYIIDGSTWQLKTTIQTAHDNSVFCVKYHPIGHYLLSGGRDAHLKVWDFDHSFSLHSSQPGHWFTVNNIAFHPEGHLFATASRDKTIKIWDASTFQLLKVIETVRDKGHINSVNALYWSEFNNYLVSCSDDRSLIVWEIFRK